MLFLKQNYASFLLSLGKGLGVISKLNRRQRFDFSYRLYNLKVGRYIVLIWKVILAFKLLEQYLTSRHNSWNDITKPQAEP